MLILIFTLLQFVTRAVRVIDLITNIEMHTFQAQGGLISFINRLEVCDIVLTYILKKLLLFCWKCPALLSLMITKLQLMIRLSSSVIQRV